MLFEEFISSFISVFNEELSVNLTEGFKSVFNAASDFNSATAFSSDISALFSFFSPR